MKTFLLAAGLSLFVTAAGAAETTCKANATHKNLAGAAMSSFMKKCETDATTACAATATEKKLAGAARTSFTKKCVGEAVGS